MKIERLFSLIGLGILAYMLDKIGIGKISAAIASLDPKYMAGFIFVLITVVIFKGIKWRASLDIFGIPISVASAVETWVIGFSLGAVTPGRVGDFAKIYYLKEKKSKSLGAVLADRLTDVFAVGLFAVMAIGVFGSVLGMTYETVILLAAVLIFALYMLKRHRNAVADVFLSRLVPERHREAIRAEMTTFYQSVRGAAKKRAAILKVTVLAVFIWMLSVVQGLFIAKSLGIGISYFLLLLILSISALIELIPVTVAGLGTREAGVVILMSFLGIPSEKALVFSLTNFIFGYLGIAAAGYLLWLRNPIRADVKKSL